MKRKVMWIVLWTTMALWLGMFWGCTATSPGKYAASPELSAESSATATAEQPTTVPASSVAEQPQAAPPVVAAPTTATEPSAMAAPPATQPGNPGVSAWDRSTWPRMVVGPASGVTRHNPIYFRDCPLPGADGPGLDMTGAAVWKLSDEQILMNALTGQTAGNWNGPNALGFGVQPLKAAFDTALMFPRMFVEPPLSTVTTP